TRRHSGAGWFQKYSLAANKQIAYISCATAEELTKQIQKKEDGFQIIQLTGNEYNFSTPLLSNKKVILRGNKEKLVKFKTENMLSLFILSGKADLILQDIHIDGKEMRATSFISSDSNGSSDHYNLSISNCRFQNFNRSSGCQIFFHAFKSMMADSIIINNSSFQ